MFCTELLLIVKNSCDLYDFRKNGCTINEMGEKKIKVSCELYSDKNLCATGGITAIRVG